jgi:hypothetical protein
MLVWTGKGLVSQISDKGGLRRFAGKTLFAVFCLAGLLLGSADGRLYFSARAAQKTIDAPTRRALLVGIAAYREERGGEATDRPSSRGSWSSLDGPPFDVDDLQAVLTSPKFGFRKEDMHVLKDRAATRANILAEIEHHLIDSAAAGDVSLFYYSGHGSRVKNSKSDEWDKRDETLVPIDARRDPKDISELKDIRDKELARLYNKAADKGIILTVITDSCHSGSNAKGYPVAEKNRQAPEVATLDVADNAPLCDGKTPASACKPPQERGVLVLSAAQEDEGAKEREYENGVHHGDFTWALIRTLRDASASLSAEQIFQRVKALMKYEGRTQEPVLAGTEARRRKPLFGVGDADATGVQVAVTSISATGSITLQGGRDIGLSEGCELEKTNAKADEPTVRLLVTRVTALSQSEARIIKGAAAAIQVSDLFEVKLWTVASAANLKVYLPPATLPKSEVIRLSVELSALRKSARVEWVSDPTEATPTHVVYFEAPVWKLMTAGGGVENLGANPTAKMIFDKLPATGKARVFVNLPPSIEMAAKVRLGEGKRYNSIAVTPSREQATYLLMGRVQDDHIQYAWVLPGRTEKSAQETATAFPLPTRTDWIMAGDTETAIAATAERLEDLALRLGKLRAWGLIEPPRSKSYFPYRLALKQTSGEIKTVGTLVEAEHYGLVLVADENDLRPYMDRHFVYVMTIDKNGNGQLLFPRPGDGNVGNRVPYKLEGQERWPTEIALGTPDWLEISEPFGTDTYILLISEEAIPNPDVLTFEGVQEKSAKGSETDLEKLINGIGAPAIKGQRATPTNWMIQRLIFRSAPKR